MGNVLLYALLTVVGQAPSWRGLPDAPAAIPLFLNSHATAQDADGAGVPSDDQVAEAIATVCTTAGVPVACLAPAAERVACLDPASLQTLGCWPHGYAEEITADRCAGLLSLVATRLTARPSSTDLDGRCDAASVFLTTREAPLLRVLLGVPGEQLAGLLSERGLPLRELADEDYECLRGVFSEETQGDLPDRDEADPWRVNLTLEVAATCRFASGTVSARLPVSLHAVGGAPTPPSDCPPPAPRALPLRDLAALVERREGRACTVDAECADWTLWLSHDPGELGTPTLVAAMTIPTGLGVTERDDGSRVLEPALGSARWMLRNGMEGRLLFLETVTEAARRQGLQGVEAVLPHRINGGFREWADLPAATQASLRAALRQAALDPARPDVRLLRWLEGVGPSEGPTVDTQLVITVTVARGGRSFAMVLEPGRVPLSPAP